jgi:hypothetical protein
MENLEQQIIDLRKKYPNDAQLGEQVRALAGSLIRSKEKDQKETQQKNDRS